MITPVRTLKVGVLCERKDDLLVSVDDIKMIAKDERAKAIDEFAEQLKKKYEHCVVNDILMNNDVMSYTNSCNVFENFIDEIAEEMRGAK